MGISYVGSATDTGNQGYTVNTASTGFTSGDLLFLCDSANDSTSTPHSAPSGYTLLHNANNGGAGASVGLYYKMASGSETTVTKSGFFSDPCVAICAFRGVNSTPIDVSGITTDASADTSVVAPTVDPQYTNGWLVTFHSARDGVTSFSTPAGMTEIVDINASAEAGTFYGSLGVFYQALTNADPTGTRTSTINTSVVHHGISVVIRAGGPLTFRPTYTKHPRPVLRREVTS